MRYRVAAGVLGHLLPVEAGKSPETVRGHTLKVGEQLRTAAAVMPSAGASAITFTVDSTFIRGRHDGERHQEGPGDNVEIPGGCRQGFRALARTHTEIAMPIPRPPWTAGPAAQTPSTAP